MTARFPFDCRNRAVIDRPYKIGSDGAVAEYYIGPREWLENLIP